MNILLFNLLNYISIENIISAYQYGNKNGKDIDIFILCKNDICYDRTEIEKFDFTIVGHRYFDHFLKSFDPIVSEPLLTGRLISGLDLLQSTQRLRSLDASDATVKHHLNMAQQVFLSAEHYEKLSLEIAFLNLVFSLSYYYFADYYANNKKVILFSYLLEKSDYLLKKAFKTYKNKQITNTKYYSLKNKISYLLDLD